MNIRKILPEDRDEIKKIFYETSSVKAFSSQEMKNNFEYKYLGWYLNHQTEFGYVASDSNQILGYIIGCPNTASAKDLIILNPMLDCFSDQYLEFPAHLHINLTENSRGRGIGSRLLDTLEINLISLGVKGLHLITSPQAENRFFYQKNGYRFEVTKLYKGQECLFMGKKLIP